MEQDELREILAEFFVEAGESLDRLESDLVALEGMASGGQTDGATVDRIFRALHTLKGGAGFLGLEKMAKLAHAGENLLDEVRGGRVQISKPVMDALLATMDGLKLLLGRHKAESSVDDVDNTGLIETLNALATGDALAAAAAATKPKAPAAPVAKAAEPVLDIQPASDMVNKDLLSEVLGDDTLHPSRDKEAQQAAAAEVLPASDMVNKDLLSEVLGDDTLHPSRDKENADASAPAAAPVAEQAAPAIPRGAAPVERRETNDDRRHVADDRRAAAGRREADAASETIRVEVSRLDKVMNLVGELVLARNSMVRQLSMAETRAAMEKVGNASLIQTSIEQLSRVTQDIQMSVLSTRMQPIKKIFDKIPRQVRELKTQLKKEVDLHIEGEMTEVDKSLVEELSDPMVHMIRNALDHGIETPAEREAAGKHPTGTLTVRAFYEGNNVVVQVSEDGKGINPEIIKKVAIKKGIITDMQAAAMSDNEAIRLIMAAGFSTAAVISDVSGRGVGMDVVNTKIQQLKGTLDIKSEVGMGTTFSIYMPLTLAIVQALVVASNKEGFAIPIGDISEVIKFDPEAIHKMSEQDVIELRGEALPLYYLARLTKPGHTPIARAGKKAAKAHAMDDLDAAVAAHTGQLAVELGETQPDNGFVVVVRDGTNSMGLVVDELIGQEEAVVKPVTEMFEFNEAISGATITGDGTVHMILDVPFMLKHMSGKLKTRRV
ncbi:MAG: chemotaxis protein CheA [Alphaproteobacteria bacterium]